VTIGAGLDVGSSSVKCAVVGCGPEGEVLLGKASGRIRRREPRAVIGAAWEEAIAAAGLVGADVDYVATTGDGELVDFRRGHFYGMTAHARGALFLDARSRAALDAGALHARAIRMDARGKVLGYRMTSQCASGSGQFLENIARYLGVTLDEVGALSRRSERPEKVSGVCAVLAETDVINMVSRGIATSDILKGIHLSMAGRFAKLVAAAGIEGPMMVTGGLAADEGLLETLREELAAQKLRVDLLAHDLSAWAGAIGAALWGAFRHDKLSRSGSEEARV
jgi:benzoyl-CoA reductase subunit D